MKVTTCGSSKIRTWYLIPTIAVNYEKENSFYFDNSMDYKTWLFIHILFLNYHLLSVTFTFEHKGGAK